MNTLYANTIRYFLIMLLMLLLTGLWMFIEHTSLDIYELKNYYAPKSFFGLLETANPHLFAMSTVFFTLTHFLALNNQHHSNEYTLAVLLFIVMIISNISGFFIGELSIFMAMVKLIFTLLLLLFSFIISVKVFFRTK